MTARLVAILNQKGGVGKTTTAVNLAHALVRRGQNGLLIDLDPQSHLSVSLGVTSPRQSGIDAVLLGQSTISQSVITVRDGLDLIVPGPRLQEIEQLTPGGPQRGDLLRQALQGHDAGHDFIFVDCPPSSGVLVANALFATQEILVPMTSDYLALQGLSHLMGTIKRFEAVLKKRYTLRLVLSRYISNRRLSKDVFDIMKKYFSGQILPTPIRETAFLAECPSFGKTIFEYRPGCRSAKDFMALADDFLQGRVI